MCAVLKRWSSSVWYRTSRPSSTSMPPPAGDGRGHAHAACGAFDAVSPRRTHQRAVRPGREGDSVGEIRFPATEGIAGTVFSSGESINIAHAYADLRFNPELDRRTGFFTRSILCVPVISNDGHIIGVTQVLNRRGGRFTPEDEQRLKAFTAQVSIALQNAKLFDDVQNMRNYSEAMLASMSNGVITLDMAGTVATCNDAGGRILGTNASSLVGSHYSEVFGTAEEIIGAMVARVADDAIRTPEMAMDVDIQRLATEGPGATSAVVSANVSVLPLVGGVGEHLGTMVVMEDISGEKRVRATMARYMDPALADELVRGDEDILGGRSVEASVLFSDVRSFTSLAEELGPQATVTLLNDYFTIMVECIQEQGGMLDKFIGDAIMAAFGLPVAHGDDADRAVHSAISMISSLFEWNKERMQDGRRPIDMGIGINTGTVVAGNIGSPKRMDFTMIGDGVNLASRLESACKQYSARILISEYTLGQLKGVYRTREVDHVVVKGKTQPVLCTRSSTTTPRRRFRTLWTPSTTSGTGSRSTEAATGRALSMRSVRRSGRTPTTPSRRRTSIGVLS